MKRQLIILLFFTLQLSAQNKDPNHHFPVEKISVPCTKDFINNYEGKWLIHKNELATNSVKEYSNEALKRLNAMNDLVREIYPQPTGSDAEWQGTFNKTSFADQVKYVMNQNNMLNEEHVKINPVYRYLYRFDLYPWNCKGPDEIMNGYPVKEGFTQLSIDANLATILPGNFLDGNEWTTDGRPIKKKLPVLEKWKGYDMCTSQGGAYVPLVHDRFVLITRPGELPYVPVTRQQFFDRAIRYVTRYWDEAIASTNVFSDKTQVEELKKDNAKAKNIAPELEKDSSDAILAQLAEYYNNSQENKIDLYNRALVFSSPFNRSGVIRNFTAYLSNNNDSQIISSGVDILSSRAKKTVSKRSKTAYLNALKEIESSLGKKINDSATANTNESGVKTVNTSTTLDLQTLKNNLHEKIEAIDK